MIDVTTAVADRISAQAGTLFAFIGLVATFAAMADLPRSSPAAYVIPLSEDVGENQALSGSVQMHSLTFGVLLIARHAGDASGARATLALQELRDAVHAAIVGWRPDGCATYVAFAGGSLEDADAGVVTWLDSFTVSRMRAAAPLN